MLSKNGIIFIIIVVFCCCIDAQEAPTVKTNSGKIRGHYLTSPSGKPYQGFEGIPFAQSPVDSLRFKDPVPVAPWSGELLANKFKGNCMGLIRSGTTGNFTVYGAEDCLYLNIYVPEKKTNKPLPVIFWIYGGGYQMGTLSGLEQKYLIDYDIIFVSPSHRVAALGYLSTEDGVVPGNMGLKDQALALKWVYENIINFGGDPKKINLIGLHSGGASIQYHYLSSWSAGMFRSGISISGTAMHYWALSKNSRAKSIKIGEALKCPTKNMVRMIDCIKKQPAEKVTGAAAVLYPWLLYSSAPFGPVVDKSSNKPFLNSDPMDLINSGKAQKVPWITGLVSEEGLLHIAGFITNNSKLQELNDKWVTVAPDLLYYEFEIPKKKQPEVGKEMLKHYLDDKPISSASVKDLLRLLNDGIYTIHSDRAARAMAKANPNSTWFYYNSYRASSGISLTIINRNKPKDFTTDFGPGHGDDVFLTFQGLLNFPITTPLTQQDLKMHDELVRFWITITKTGNPKSFVSEWPTVNAENPNLDYLHMAGPGNFKPKTFSNFGEKDFWKNINILK